MWPSKDRSQQRDNIFKELITEIRGEVRGFGRVSPALKRNLEMFSMAERAEIVNRVRDGHTPLFLAAKKGIIEFVRYLVEHCGADIEKKGVYEVHNDHSTHYVTPLWCAAVVGQLEICQFLVKHGADVNAVSDTGSSAVRSACYMTHIDIVKFLVANGADINRANDNGGTCLINSVQSVQLCEFLLSQGADINARDSQFKTALHYAVQEERLETTELLLFHGADYLAKSKHGDDALQTACLTGNSAIVEHLIRNKEYPPERVADAYELLGTTSIEEKHNVGLAIDQWRRAVLYRREHSVQKVCNDPPKAVFQNHVPFQTTDDLDRMAYNMDEVRTQSLMIAERVLGADHKDYIYRLMYRGAAYADGMQHQRCIDLWTYAIELRLKKDTILHHETCVAFQSLLKILLDLYDKYESGTFDYSIRMTDIIVLMEKFVEEIPSAMHQLRQIPVHRKHLESWDLLLRVLVHLLHLAEVLPKSACEEAKVRKMTRQLVQFRPLSSNSSTLLHLVVGRVDSIQTTHNFDELKRMFPDEVTTRMLLKAGALVEEVNRDGSTALHVASLRVNYRESIVKMLLDAGAHIDRTNDQGNQPYRMLGGNQECKLKVANMITLKCLAASKIKSLKIDYENAIPKSLESFVKMH